MIGVLDAPMIVDVPDEAQPMKLSDAIRIGSQLRPKCVAGYFRGGGSCALGAAYEARTGEVDLALDIVDLFPILGQEMIHPKNESRYETQGRLLGIIADLNDEWGWTREQIADWLAGQGL